MTAFDTCKYQGKIKLSTYAKLTRVGVVLPCLAFRLPEFFPVLYQRTSQALHEINRHLVYCAIVLQYNAVVPVLSVTSVFP